MARQKAWRAGCCRAAADCCADARESSALAGQGRRLGGSGARSAGGGSDEDAERSTLTEGRQSGKTLGKRKSAGECRRRAGMGGVKHKADSFGKSRNRRSTAYDGLGMTSGQLNSAV